MYSSTTDAPVTPTHSSGRIANRQSFSRSRSPEIRAIRRKAFSYQKRHHAPTLSIESSHRSTYHRAKRLKRRLWECQHGYEDEVMVWLFKSQRDKCIEHQIDMVQSALEDIQREIWYLHKAITFHRMTLYIQQYSAFFHHTN